MKVFRCDKCGKETKAIIFLRGYHPKLAGGILLPELFKSHDFCSHECFVEWMREALTKEP